MASNPASRNRDAIIARYSGLARTALAGGAITDGDPGAVTDAGCGAAAYTGTDGAPQDALRASLGCGNPLAVADLHPGQTVLDLGSAAAWTCCCPPAGSPGGTAYGLDASPDMLVLARANAVAAGVTNATFLHGHIEDIRCPTGTWTWSSPTASSTCPPTGRVLAEAFRVLRPGGGWASATSSPMRAPHPPSSPPPNGRSAASTAL